MDFEHPLGSKLKFFNLEPVPTNGSHHTINSGFWDSGNPFKMTAGGVIRMVVDFANAENSPIVSPPGQSGHYRSPYYGDLAQLWANGGQISMNFNDANRLANVLILKPGG
jgi:penicillin amidase